MITTTTLGFVARFLVYRMTAARCLKAQTPLYAVSLAVVGALSWLLVPHYGLNGAAWARSRLLAVDEPLPALSTDLL
jgi:O-antigen/teichoic acid export membrane protein